MGMGRATWGMTPPAPPAPLASPPSSSEEEIATLRQTANELRNQLAQVLERLERLEKEG